MRSKIWSKLIFASCVWYSDRASFFSCFAHIYFPVSGQALVTGVVPSSPRFLPSLFIEHRVQQSHCSSIFHRVLLTHALVFSASQFLYYIKSRYTGLFSKILLKSNTSSMMYSIFFFFLFFILRRMGKNKALAHHTSTYFHTRRVSILTQLLSQPNATWRTLRVPLEV